MTAALQRTFGAWLDLSKDQEVRELLDLVRVALERRGFVVACAVSEQKIPSPKEGVVSASYHAPINITQGAR